MKFGLGMTLLGLGFRFLLTEVWVLIQNQLYCKYVLVDPAYLFHTLGELCISPVGLSYVSKLVPATCWNHVWVYYLFIGMGNKIAGSMGGMIETISTQYSLSTFFMIFTVVSIAIGLLMILLTQ
jgi:POT family proton-dependent oligopeptide transporter